MMDAEEVIKRLNMRPHPEGGHYVETWRDQVPVTERGKGSAIYYLLKDGEKSVWHRIDAVEVWHFYAGAPLSMHLSPDGRSIRSFVLGNDFEEEEVPQVVVPAGNWQTARSLGDWTLVGCTTTPAFVFAGFEHAPDGWSPAANRDTIS